MDLIETQMRKDSPSEPRQAKPAWLKTKIPSGESYFKIKRELRQNKLFTVCEEAKCPNISECWSSGTATFMVLGDTCTRACKFCHVKTGDPAGWLDPEEPEKTAKTIALMNLKYAVITMVDRDDLEDGGVAHLKKVLSSVRKASPNTTIEFLTGDFGHKQDPLFALSEEGPHVFAHNVETVERLTPRVRDARASYRGSLEVLRLYKKWTEGRVDAQTKHRYFTKTGVMLGHGESRDELLSTFDDLRAVGVDFLTLGQYMRPTKKHLSIKRLVHPDEFKELEFLAYEKGFLGVSSGPLVRSSYKAGEHFEKAVRELG